MNFCKEIFEIIKNLIKIYFFTYMKSYKFIYFIELSLFLY